MKQACNPREAKRNMQLSDPPTEPLQLFLLNIIAAATLSAACPEIATASRTGCRDAAEPLAKSFYDCPSPFRRVALSHAYLPSPHSLHSVRLGIDTHNLQTGSQCSAVQGRATVYTGAMHSHATLLCCCVCFMPLHPLLLASCSLPCFTWLLSLLLACLVGFFLPGHVNDPSCLEICI